MNKLFATIRSESVEQVSVSKTQIKRAFERAQMQIFPFLCLRLVALFLLYAIIQGLILRENQAALLGFVALISAFILLGVRTAVLREIIPDTWANPLYAFTAGLVLISMLLRLFITSDAKQSANLAFFLVGIGMLKFSKRWFLAVTAVTLGSWLVGVLTIPGDGDWGFFIVLVLAAAATGSIAQHIITQNYRQSEVLRFENGRLLNLTQQFNQKLEDKVQERTQELQAAYTRLERLDKTKSDFITIASHELRTPLTILNTYNQMLLHDDGIRQNSDYLKQVQGIHEGATRIEEVVETMLDVAKIDSQTLGLQIVPVNVPLLIHLLGQQFASTFAERNLMFQIDNICDLPDVKGDSEALQKVFRHLIVNAIKYTPDDGHILISGVEHSTPPTVEIIVTDSGVGIAPEAQELIFEKFYQTGAVALHSSGKTSFRGGGSGLGLAIAKGIVEAHNGRIWVESPGHNEETCPGSAFHVVLPGAGN